MKRTITTLAVTISVALAGAIAVGSPALAADGKSLDAAKAAVTNRINLRLTALARDTTVLGAAKNISADHKATLTALVGQDTTGLGTLKTKVAGETTVDAVRADATSMVQDYRIFILVGPKVRLTSAGDTEAAAMAKLRTAHDNLASLVAKARAAGKDTSAAEQQLADMAAALGKADSDANGQVAAVLAIQPGPDAAGIQAQVSAVRAGLAAARADIKAALADAKKVRDFLKGLKN
jgi:hypothetical protein